MTLTEMEQAIQERLDYMAKMDDFDFSEWLECYRTLAQVKQARAAERIASLFEGWSRSGVPVERVS